MATKRWTSGSASMATSSASTRARTMSACDGAFDDDARARVARDRRSRARGTDLGREAATRALHGRRVGHAATKHNTRSTRFKIATASCESEHKILPLPL